MTTEVIRLFKSDKFRIHSSGGKRVILLSNIGGDQDVRYLPQNWVATQ